MSFFFFFFFNMEQLNSSLELFDVSDVSNASCEIFDDRSSTSCENIWHSTPIKKSAASCEVFDDPSSTSCENIWHSTPIKNSAYASKDPAPECTSRRSETEIEIFDQSTSSGKYCNLNACQIHFFL